MLDNVELEQCAPLKRDVGPDDLIGQATTEKCERWLKEKGLERILAPDQNNAGKASGEAADFVRRMRIAYTVLDCVEEGLGPVRSEEAGIEELRGEIADMAKPLLEMIKLGKEKPNEAVSTSVVRHKRGGKAHDQYIKMSLAVTEKLLNLVDHLSREDKSLSTKPEKHRFLFDYVVNRVTIPGIAKHKNCSADDSVWRYVDQDKWMKYRRAFGELKDGRDAFASTTVHLAQALEIFKRHSPPGDDHDGDVTSANGDRGPVAGPSSNGEEDISFPDVPNNDPDDSLGGDSGRKRDAAGMPNHGPAQASRPASPPHISASAANDTSHTSEGGRSAGVNNFNFNFNFQPTVVVAPMLFVGPLINVCSESAAAHGGPTMPSSRGGGPRAETLSGREASAAAGMASGFFSHANEGPTTPTPVGDGMSQRATALLGEFMRGFGASLARNLETVSNHANGARNAGAQGMANPVSSSTYSFNANGSSSKGAYVGDSPRNEAGPGIFSANERSSGVFPRNVAHPALRFGAPTEFASGVRGPSMLSGQDNGIGAGAYGGKSSAPVGNRNGASSHPPEMSSTSSNVAGTSGEDVKAGNEEDLRSELVSLGSFVKGQLERMNVGERTRTGEIADPVSSGRSVREQSGVDAGRRGSTGSMSGEMSSMHSSAKNASSAVQGSAGRSFIGDNPGGGFEMRNTHTEPSGEESPAIEERRNGASARALETPSTSTGVVAASVENAKTSFEEAVPEVPAGLEAALEKAAEHIDVGRSARTGETAAERNESALVDVAFEPVPSVAERPSAKEASGMNLPYELLPGRDANSVAEEYRQKAARIESNVAEPLTGMEASSPDASEESAHTGVVADPASEVDDKTLVAHYREMDDLIDRNEELRQERMQSEDMRAVRDQLASLYSPSNASTEEAAATALPHGESHSIPMGVERGMSSAGSSTSDGIEEAALGESRSVSTDAGGLSTQASADSSSMGSYLGARPRNEAGARLSWPNGRPSGALPRNAAPPASVVSASVENARTSSEEAVPEMLVGLEAVLEQAAGHIKVGRSASAEETAAPGLPGQDGREQSVRGDEDLEQALLATLRSQEDASGAMNLARGMPSSAKNAGSAEQGRAGRPFISSSMGLRLNMLSTHMRPSNSDASARATPAKRLDMGAGRVGVQAAPGSFTSMEEPPPAQRDESVRADEGVEPKLSVAVESRVDTSHAINIAGEAFVEELPETVEPLPAERDESAQADVGFEPALSVAVESRVDTSHAMNIAGEAFVEELPETVEPLPVERDESAQADVGFEPALSVAVESRVDTSHAMNIAGEAFVEELPETVEPLPVERDESAQADVGFEPALSVAVESRVDASHAMSVAREAFVEELLEMVEPLPAERDESAQADVGFEPASSVAVESRAEASRAMNIAREEITEDVTAGVEPLPAQRDESARADVDFEPARSVAVESRVDTSHAMNIAGEAFVEEVPEIVEPLPVERDESAQADVGFEPASSVAVESRAEASRAMNIAREEITEDVTAGVEPLPAQRDESARADVDFEPARSVAVESRADASGAMNLARGMPSSAKNAGSAEQGRAGRPFISSSMGLSLHMRSTHMRPSNSDASARATPAKRLDMGAGRVGVQAAPGSFTSMEEPPPAQRDESVRADEGVEPKLSVAVESRVDASHAMSVAGDESAEAVTGIATVMREGRDGSARVDALSPYQPSVRRRWRTNGEVPPVSKSSTDPEEDDMVAEVSMPAEGYIESRARTKPWLAVQEMYRLHPASWEDEAASWGIEDDESGQDTEGVAQNSVQDATAAEEDSGIDMSYESLPPVNVKEYVEHLRHLATITERYAIRNGKTRSDEDKKAPKPYDLAGNYRRLADRIERDGELRQEHLDEREEIERECESSKRLLTDPRQSSPGADAGSTQVKGYIGAENWRL